MYEEQQYIFDLVRAGATGYLLKDSESSQIVAAIRAIYRGRVTDSSIRREQNLGGVFPDGPKKGEKTRLG